MKNNQKFMVFGFFSYLLLGLFMTGFAAAIPIIREEEFYKDLNYEMIGIVLALGSVGFFGGSLVGGVAIEKLSLKATLLLGVLISPFGLLLVIFSRNVGLLAMGNFLVGFGNGFLETGIPPMSSLFTKKTTKILNILHSFFSLGALVAPVILSFLLRVGLNWRVLFAIMIAIFLMNSYFILTLKVDFSISKEKKSVKKSFRFLLSPYFWVLCIGVAFYVASEAGNSSWSPTFAVDRFEYIPATAALLPTFFWIGLFLGRVISALIVEKVGAYKWLFWITLIGLPIVFLTQYPMSSQFYFFSFTFLSGLIHASIYPTLQSLLVQDIKEGTGYALGVFASMGSLGGTAAGYVIGAISQGFGIHIGFLSAFFFFFCTFLSAVFLNIQVARRKFR